MSMSGVFEFGLGATGVGANLQMKSGYAGSFFTGVLATVVATPCTAPFMGTAVGFALGQPALVALSIFTALGIGLALPYVLLPWIPGLLRILPRPGAWMETFKQAMGFLLLGTVLWLAWVLGAQCGAERVVLLFAGLLLVGVGAWVLRRWPEPFAATAIAVVLMLVGALGPAWQAQVQSPAERGAQANSDDDLPWEPFSPQQLAAYRAQGKPVFLDFTAAWCVSCKVNERLVLKTQEVRQRIRELGVIPMKADWTSYDPVITQKLAEHGRSGIPFYVLYGRTPNAPGIELPTVLTTSSVLRTLDQLGK
jgi:thiol:disulfide interchange protein